MTSEKASKSKFRIGIVGGGKRCETIIEMSQRRHRPKVNASVVIIAEPDPHDPIHPYAHNLGIETTTDLEVLAEVKDLDFVL
ncbi:MAG: hypothetical protein SWE60_16610, partial [Thermodesulfobacteriota bacterium]|nr:hypothetical protein [Thermodesulfobacteriota bacterium]